MRADFSTSEPFYQVIRLQDLKSKTSVEMRNGQYDLHPGRDYELIVDYFLPSQAPGAFQLETALSGGTVTFITGSTMQIDSP